MEELVEIKCMECNKSLGKIPKKEAKYQAFIRCEECFKKVNWENTFHLVTKKPREE